MKDHESLRARPHWNACLGTRDSVRAALRRGEGGSPTPAPAELVIVDLIAQHDEQSHQQLPGDGDFGLGASTPMDEPEVGSLEIGIHAGRMRSGLTEGEAEERAALLGDVPEMI